MEFLMNRSLCSILVLTLCFSLGAWAQETPKKPAHHEKVAVVITHEVKDYGAWRKGYDADEPNRKQAGFTVSGVYADVHNPNSVTIIGEFPSAAAAEAFATSPTLKEAMEKAGVVGKPDVKVLSIRHK
jgi:quinol monooxygenase YgiN